MAFTNSGTSWKSLHALNQEREAIENIIEREALWRECDNGCLRIGNRELTQRMELVMMLWKGSIVASKKPGCLVIYDKPQSSICELSSCEDNTESHSADMCPTPPENNPILSALSSPIQPNHHNHHIPQISIDNCFGGDWKLDFGGIHVEQVTSQPGSPEPEVVNQFLDPSLFIGKGLTSQLTTPRTPRDSEVSEREMTAFVFWHWDGDCDGILSEDETRRFVESNEWNQSWDSICFDVGIDVNEGLKPKDFIHLLYLRSNDSNLGIVHLYGIAKRLSREQNFDNVYNEHRLITIFNKWDSTAPHGFWSHDDAVACQRTTQPNEPVPSSEEWSSLCSSLGASPLGLSSSDLALLYSMGNDNQLHLDFEASRRV